MKILVWTLGIMAFLLALNVFTVREFRRFHEGCMVCGNPDTIETVEYVSKGIVTTRHLCRLHEDNAPEEVRRMQSLILAIITLLSPLFVPLIIVSAISDRLARGEDWGKNADMAVIVEVFLIIPLALILCLRLYWWEPAFFWLAGLFILLGLLVLFILFCALVSSLPIPVPPKVKAEASRVWQNVKDNIKLNG